MSKLLIFMMERAMGFEPTTPTLARLCSTPELHPHPAPGASRLYAAKPCPLQILAAAQNLPRQDDF